MALRPGMIDACEQFKIGIKALRVSGLSLARTPPERRRLFRERFFGEPYVKISKLQIVENARALIQEEQHWCRGMLARDAGGLSVDPTYSRATQRCALGALVSAAFHLTNDHWQAYDLAMSALRPTCGSATLVRVNDMRGHAAVLALLDDALATM